MKNVFLSESLREFLCIFGYDKKGGGALVI